MSEIVEVVSREIAIVAHPRQPQTVVVERRQVEVVEVAKQGPRGPSAADTFDTDIALLYQIAKL